MIRTGYLHPMYPQSLIEFGELIELPASKGWILKRPIPGTVHFDGMGCYPFFACEDWSSLGDDLDRLSNQLVSVSLVTDPFGSYSQEGLLRQFKDIARPYKKHFIIDLQRRPEDFVSSHHQRNAYKALKTVTVETCNKPILFLDEWESLYENLIARHNIKGMTRFSHGAFVKQLSVPGIVAVRATVDNKTVGMVLWYVQGKMGYYHLGAYNSLGYELKASFALFWYLLGYFKEMGLNWLSLGAGAGAFNNADDGLTRFKRGWSTDTRLVFFCGRIFDHDRYTEIVHVKGYSGIKFFPAYRHDDFG